MKNPILPMGMNQTWSSNVKNYLYSLAYASTLAIQNAEISKKSPLMKYTQLLDTNNNWRCTFLWLNSHQKKSKDGKNI
ncbi:hypothetical protein HFP66_00115 [Bacillus sp. A17A.1]